MSAVKRPATLDQQLSLLRERGMQVDDVLARQWLSNVSYYRLSGYWYPYRCFPEDDTRISSRRLDSFEPGTTFTDITKLYEFDRKMRTLIHDGIERIEVALRARVGELIISKGAVSYQDAQHFRPDFEHSKWLKTASTRIRRARKYSKAIDHYATHYRDYPFWVMADVLGFSGCAQILLR